MIDHLPLLRPYLLCSLLDWGRANKANWQNVFIDRERKKTKRMTWQYKWLQLEMEEALAQRIRPLNLEGMDTDQLKDRVQVLSIWHFDLLYFFDLLFWSAFLSIICCLLLSMNVTFFVVGVLESLYKSEGREGTIGEKVFQNLKLNFERFLLICFNHFFNMLLLEGP